jgi:putative ABC transport system ATP-binding protein
MPSAERRSLVELIDVHKSYGSGDASSVALSGISLEIRAGSFVSLMGPSGSGKTTLLNLIAGLDAPDSGRVILDGNDLATLPGNALADFRLHNVGFVFQAFNLVPSLTVANNVAWPLEFAGVRRGEVRTRVEEALERTGVSGRERRFPAELSGGEQQRVAIARAIATRPRLMLADEPTGNLDSHSGRLVLDLLADLNRAERVTIVMVTHNAFAAAYGDRTLEVRDGRLVRDIAAPMRAAGAHHDVGSR